MMRNLAIGMCAAVLVFTPQVAAAQSTPTPTPSPRPTTPNMSVLKPDTHRYTAGNTFQKEYDSKVLLDPKAPAANYNAAIEVASCVAKKDPETAATLLGGPMTADPQYNKLVKALGSRKFDRCIARDAVGTPISLINGALAEQLLRNGGAQTMEDRAEAVNVSQAEVFYKDPSGRSMDSVGRCIAVYSPGLAYKLLGTSVGSAQEATALQDVFAKTPECGVAASPADIPSSEQRGAIATGLYGWTHRG